MRIVVPKMSLRDYLELAGDLKKDPRFNFSNQDLEQGWVKFRSEDRLRMLGHILDYHNTGRLPPSTIKINAVSESKMEKLGFNFKAWQESLGEVRGPDSNGFYTGQCPSCARRGGDSDKNHLAFTGEGVVHCYAGCEFFSIIDGYYKKEEKA
jgi:hypothetical protein